MAQYVDEQTVDMAPADTWVSLSVNQLMETKYLLQNKLYMARGKPAYMRPLQIAMARLDSIIQDKIDNPSSEF